MIDHVRFPGPTWPSGHVYGDCSINHHRKLFIVNIPKCASSWVKEYTSLLGDTPDNTWVGGNFTTDNLDDYQPIIVLRDPVSRWISHSPIGNGLYDMIRDYETDSFFFINLHKSLYQDEHTAPQTDFIKGLNLNNAIYFLADKHLTQKFENYIIGQMFPKVDIPDYVNRSPDDVDTLQKKNIWRNLLSVPKYFQQFEHAYRDDYSLINSTKFY
jgi:hypothetical protein